MKRLPFLLSPAPKDYLWGGTRLHDEFGKDLSCFPLAETWECSTHPDGQSLVASGVFSGTKLGDLLSEQPDMLGTHPLQLTGGKAELPILIKLIDAKEKLSVQVHPDDDYARLHGAVVYSACPEAGGNCLRLPPVHDCLPGSRYNQPRYDRGLS